MTGINGAGPIARYSSVQSSKYQDKLGEQYLKAIEDPSKSQDEINAAETKLIGLIENNKLSPEFLKTTWYLDRWVKTAFKSTLTPQVTDLILMLIEKNKVSKPLLREILFNNKLNGTKNGQDIQNCALEILERHPADYEDLCAKRSLDIIESSKSTTEDKEKAEYIILSLLKNNKISPNLLKDMILYKTPNDNIYIAIMDKIKSLIPTFSTTFIDSWMHEARRKYRGPLGLKMGRTVELIGLLASNEKSSNQNTQETILKDSSNQAQLYIPGQLQDKLCILAEQLTSQDIGDFFTFLKNRIQPEGSVEMAEDDISIEIHKEEDFPQFNITEEDVNGTTDVGGLEINGKIIQNENIGDIHIEKDVDGYIVSIYPYANFGNDLISQEQFPTLEEANGFINEKLNNS